MRRRGSCYRRTLSPSSRRSTRSCSAVPTIRSLRASFNLSLPRSFSEDIALVDSAEALTAQLAELLAGHDLAAPEQAGRRTFFVQTLERFTRVGGQFFPSETSPRRPQLISGSEVLGRSRGRGLRLTRRDCGADRVCPCRHHSVDTRLGCGIQQLGPVGSAMSDCFRRPLFRRRFPSWTRRCASFGYHRHGPRPNRLPQNARVGVKNLGLDSRVPGRPRRAQPCRRLSAEDTLRHVLGPWRWRWIFSAS